MIPAWPQRTPEHCSLAAQPCATANCCPEQALGISLAEAFSPAATFGAGTSWVWGKSQEGWGLREGLGLPVAKLRWARASGTKLKPRKVSAASACVCEKVQRLAPKRSLYRSPLAQRPISQESRVAFACACEVLHVECGSSRVEAWAMATSPTPQKGTAWMQFSL